MFFGYWGGGHCLVGLCHGICHMCHVHMDISKTRIVPLTYLLWKTKIYQELESLQKTCLDMYIVHNSVACYFSSVKKILVHYLKKKKKKKKDVIEVVG